MILHYGKVPTGVRGRLYQLSNLIYCSHSIAPFPESSVIFIAMMSFQTLAETNRSETGHVRSNYLNLQIANQKAQTFQLLLYIEDNCLVGEWRLNTPSTVQYHIYMKKTITSRRNGGTGPFATIKFSDAFSHKMSRSSAMNTLQEPRTNDV